MIKENNKQNKKRYWLGIGSTCLVVSILIAFTYRFKLKFCSIDNITNEVVCNYASIILFVVIISLLGALIGYIEGKIKERKTKQ